MDPRIRYAQTQVSLFSLQPAAGRSNVRQLTLTQSEHLNFFSEHSMRVLSNLVGARIDLYKTEIETPDGKKTQVLQCLFVKLQGPDVLFARKMGEQ